MRLFWQRDWQGIAFAGFCRPDPRRIADAVFYSAFYDELFRRYAGWHALDPGWMETKRVAAEFVKSRLPDGGPRVLTIGCGLGAIEKRLIELGVSVEVTEITDKPLRWLKEALDASAFHIGLFPQCMPRDRRYDFVLLSGVDYCFDQKEWIELLRATSGVIGPQGKCLVLSSSIDRAGLVGRCKARLKEWLIRFYPPRSCRYQLWGYLRTREEFQKAMHDSGIASFTDGFLMDSMYWIEGRRPQ